MLGLSLGLFFIISVPYFGSACDHGNSFRALKSKKENAMIQFWNLGFVEAYQNSILRRQGLSI